MAQQNLNGAKIGAGLQQMSREAMTQRVGMGLFLKARSQGSFVAGMPDGFSIDRLLTARVAVTWKQSSSGLGVQAMPMGTQFVEQFWAEHDVTISTPFAALDVNHHPFAIDVAELQAGELRVADSGSVQRH